MSVMAGVRVGPQEGLRDVLPQVYVDLCLKSDALREWCLYLVGRGRRPATGLPPELLDLIRYLLEHGVIDRNRLREIGPDIADAVIKELRHSISEVRGGLVSRRPEVVEGRLRELVEKVGKLAPVVRAAVGEPELVVKEVARTELRPDLAEEVGKLVGRPAKEAEPQIKAITEKIVRAELATQEEVASRMYKVEAGKETLQAVRPKAELRK